jgi:hypothetical protein
VSYDLYLLPLEPGEDPEEALERLEEAEESTADAAALRRLADAVQARFPQLDRHESDGSVELTSLDDSKPYQISIFGNQGGANVPYWHDDERADATYRELLEALDVVREHTGWSIFDPQLGRVIDPQDLPDILGGHARGVDAVHRITAGEERPRGFFRRLFGG